MAEALSLIFHSRSYGACLIKYLDNHHSCRAKKRKNTKMRSLLFIISNLYDCICNCRFNVHCNITTHVSKLSRFPEKDSVKVNPSYK